MAGNIVPRQDSVGTIGTEDKRWGQLFSALGMSDGTDNITPGASTVAEFILNSDATGSATEDVFLSVNRGSDTKASIKWDETANAWYFGLVGNLKAIADAAELYKIRTGSDVGETPAYLSSKIDTDQLQIATGYKLQIKDIYVKLTGDQTIGGVKTFTNGIVTPSITQSGTSGILVYGNLDLQNTYKITNSIAPSVGSDLVNKDYVDSHLQGISWQEPVDTADNAPPSTPVADHRYLVGASPTGAWVGHANAVATWTGSTWEYDAPSEGWALYCDADDKQYVYNGTAWVNFGSTTTHNSTTGLQGGVAGEYYHLSEADYNNLSSSNGSDGTPTFASVTTTDLTSDTLGATTPSGSIAVSSVLASTANITTTGQVKTNTIAANSGTTITIGSCTVDGSTVTLSEIAALAGTVTIPGGTLDATNATFNSTIVVDTISPNSETDVTVAGVVCDTGSVSATNVTATGYVKTDTINENTPTNGVLIDSVKCKDGSVYIDYQANGGNTALYTNVIKEFHTNDGVTIEDVLVNDGNVTAKAGTGIVSAPYVRATTKLTADHIGEYTTDNDVIFDNDVQMPNLALSGGLTVTGTIAVDQIVGRTDADAVQIDGVTLDTGVVTLAGLVGSGTNSAFTFPGGSVNSTGMTLNTQLLTDHIVETTSSHGVMVDDVLLKDLTVNADTFNAVADSNYKIAFNNTAKRFEFNGVQAGGSTVKTWTFEVDENGDLMPYVA